MSKPNACRSRPGSVCRVLGFKGDQCFQSETRTEKVSDHTQLYASHLGLEFESACTIDQNKSLVGSGLRVTGSVFRVQGLGIRVWEYLGFRVGDVSRF